MASILPFNTVKKNNGNTTVLTTADFVNGSGNYIMTGSDIKAVSTADGKKHNVRHSIDRQANGHAYWNKLDISSPLTTNTNLADADAEVYELYYNSTLIYKRHGVLHCSYDQQRMVTEFTIVFDSEIQFAT